MHNPNVMNSIVAEQHITEHRASAARSRLAHRILPRARRFRGRPALHASAPRGRPTFPSAAR